MQADVTHRNIAGQVKQSNWLHKLRHE